MMEKAEILIARFLRHRGYMVLWFDDPSMECPAAEGQPIRSCFVHLYKFKIGMERP
jgi:hypothetical protein